jgi:hypothetical protein
MEGLPDRLRAAPGLFRKALKAARGGGVSTPPASEPTEASSAELMVELRRTAEIEQIGQARESLAELCACRALSAEVAALGGVKLACSVHRVHTMAQAACFRAQSVAWIAARERLLAQQHGQASVASASATSSAEDDGFREHGYANFDSTRFDFHGLVLRMLAEDAESCGGLIPVPPVESSVGTPAGHWDPLAMLHLSEAGCREAGYLQDAHSWAAAGLEYTRALDDATRYGCGVFNRAWKASTLRGEFLQLYDAFIAEVIAPMLGSSELLYQASPVFRVFLPGHLGVGPRHTDAAYHEQPNEINFWVPCVPWSRPPPPFRALCLVPVFALPLSACLLTQTSTYRALPPQSHRRIRHQLAAGRVAGGRSRP